MASDDEEKAAEAARKEQLRQEQREAVTRAALRRSSANAHGQCMWCGKIFDLHTKKPLPPERQPIVPGIRGEYESRRISHGTCEECDKSGRARRVMLGQEPKVPDAVPLSRAEVRPRHWYWRNIFEFKQPPKEK